jgi:hypothetical protein
LSSNTSGSYNTAMGSAALHLATGSDNTAVGSSALFFLTTGNQNTAVGYGINFGNCSTCSNTGAFGYGVIPTASNTIKFGDSVITQIGGYAPWSNLSDRRYKTNIKQNVPGLDFISKLKPVTFNWELSKLNESDGAEEFATDPLLGEAREAKAGKVYTGFIAQDVEAAARQCGFDFSGIVKPANERSRYHLAYAEFVVPLVKAVQEQQTEIEDLGETVRTAERRLRDGRLGKGADHIVSQQAGTLGTTLGGGMLALVSTLLLLLHLKRWRVSRAGILSLLSLALPFVAAPAQAQTDNTPTGASALISISSGDYNTATGAFALRDNTTGSGNTATGRGAMYSNIGGVSNTAVGHSAMYWNTEGDYNVAVGELALQSNTTGVSNTAIGYRALFTNATGNQNTAVGDGALFSNTGSSNTATGFAALTDNTSGSYNTALGTNALSSNTTGFGNTAMGMEALLGSVTGSDNTAVGYRALSSLLAGNQNTAVGSRSSTSCLNCSNTGAFGYNAQPTASNTIRIGNSAITQIGGYAPWSNLSDGRYKTNVKQNVPGLDFISKLKPVTFNWELSKLNESDGAEEFASDPVLGEAREAKASKVYSGFIAQDVEAAARQCGFDFSGLVKPANDKSRYHLAYAEFVVPLVKALQEQQKEIEKLGETVRALATERRMRDGRLGKGVSPIGSEHAGVLGDSLGGLMAFVSALLLLLHAKQLRSLLKPRES